MIDFNYMHNILQCEILYMRTFYFPRKKKKRIRKYLLKQGFNP